MDKIPYICQSTRTLCYRFVHTIALDSLHLYFVVLIRTEIIFFIIYQKKKRAKKSEPLTKSFKTKAFLNEIDRKPLKRNELFNDNLMHFMGELT